MAGEEVRNKVVVLPGIFLEAAMGGRVCTAAHRVVQKNMSLFPPNSQTDKLYMLQCLRARNECFAEFDGIIWVCLIYAQASDCWSIYHFTPPAVHAIATLLKNTEIHRVCLLACRTNAGYKTNVHGRFYQA